jgi:hypothetical protein
MDPTSTTPDGGTPTGGTPATKKAAKYKAMVKKAPVNDGDADNQPTSLMVQKADGSIGPWGNDTVPAKKPVPQTKSAPQMSDKARGYSNTYYTPNH